MSTMVSMCSMSTGHSSTQAPQVGQDHSTSGSMVPGTRVGHLDVRRPSAALLSAEASIGQPSSRAEEANMLSRSPMMRSLGDSGLLGVPGRAGRLAPPALGAGGEVQHLLPGELLDVADPEDGVLGHVLHVHVRGLVERPQGPGPPREGHVDGGQEDVQVLGVGDEDQEAR